MTESESETGRPSVAPPTRRWPTIAWIVASGAFLATFDFFLTIHVIRRYRGEEPYWRYGGTLAKPMNPFVDLVFMAFLLIIWVTSSYWSICRLRRSDARHTEGGSNNKVT
jgi:hypothetical protein